MLWPIPKWPSRPDIVHIAGAVAVRPPKGLRLGLDLGVNNSRSNIFWYNIYIYVCVCISYIYVLLYLYLYLSIYISIYIYILILVLYKYIWYSICSDMLGCFKDSVKTLPTVSQHLMQTTMDRCPATGQQIWLPEQPTAQSRSSDRVCCADSVPGWGLCNYVSLREFNIMMTIGKMYI
jgi:hypothetical protein